MQNFCGRLWCPNKVAQRLSKTRNRFAHSSDCIPLKVDLSSDGKTQGMLKYSSGPFVTLNLYECIKNHLVTTKTAWDKHVDNYRCHYHRSPLFCRPRHYQIHPRTIEKNILPSSTIRFWPEWGILDEMLVRLTMRLFIIPVSNPISILLSFDSFMERWRW